MQKEYKNYTLLPQPKPPLLKRLLSRKKKGTDPLAGLAHLELPRVPLRPEPLEQSRSLFYYYGVVGKALFKAGLASTAVSTATLLCPWLVSKPGADYVADTKVDGTMLREASKERDIRVYHRYNPLTAFHSAGQLGYASFMLEFENGTSSTPTALFNSSVTYTSALLKNVLFKLIPEKLDASAQHGVGRNGIEGTCFVYPAGNFKLHEFASSMAMVKSAQFPHLFNTAAKEKISEQEDRMTKALQQFVLDHEFRHCAQGARSMPSGVRELDSDRAALAMLMVDKKQPDYVKKHAGKMVQHARVIKAVVSGHIYHASSAGLGGTSASTSHYEYMTTGQAELRLHLLASVISKQLGPDYIRQTTTPEFYYHVIRRLNEDGKFSKDAELKAAASRFTDAVDYYNHITGGKVLNHGTRYDHIKLKELDTPYVPVPGGFKTPAKSVLD